MSSSWNRWTDRSTRLVRLAAGTSLAALALSLGAARVEAQSLKLATLVPEGSVWDKAVRRMGSDWKKQTGSKVSLLVYPGGVAGDEPDLIRKMRIGQLHAAMLSVSGLGEIDPAFIVFEVPGLFRTDAEVRYVMEQMGPAFEKRLDAKGYKLLHWGNAGWLRLFSTEPIESFEDFEGMKHFVWGSDSRMGSWYEERGIRTVPLSATDVLPALQTKLVDAVPVTPLAALSLQWFRSAPYMFEQTFAPLVGATVVSKRAWNRIQPADQKSMLDVAAKTGDYLFAEVPKQEAQALIEMEKRGLTITKWAGDSDFAKWKAFAEYFQKRMREESVPPEVFDEAKRHVLEYRRSSGEATD